VNGSRPTTGSRVSFRLGVVSCPDVEQVTRDVGSELEVTGEVMFLSDGNGREDEFAIVEVPGLMTPVIVPVRALTLRESGSPTAAGIRES